MSVVDEIRSNMERNLPGLPSEQIDSMVEFEVKGLAACERVVDAWCECGDTVLGVDSNVQSYYRKASGTHGWFHDPLLGGCGGITQSG